MRNAPDYDMEWDWRLALRTGLHEDTNYRPLRSPARGQCTNAESTMEWLTLLLNRVDCRLSFELLRDWIWLVRDAQDFPSPP